MQLHLLSHIHHFFSLVHLHIQILLHYLVFAASTSASFTHSPFRFSFPSSHSISSSLPIFAASSSSALTHSPFRLTCPSSHSNTSSLPVFAKNATSSSFTHSPFRFTC
eukprot:202122_1